MCVSSTSLLSLQKKNSNAITFLSKCICCCCLDMNMIHTRLGGLNNNTVLGTSIQLTSINGLTYCQSPSHVFLVSLYHSKQKRGRASLSAMSILLFLQFLFVALIKFSVRQFFKAKYYYQILVFTNFVKHVTHILLH